jgi:glycerophosphoryl diester phosphodiesterase
MSSTDTPWPRRAPGGAVPVLAHRGGIGPWRENTLEAFAAARAAGADGVELDVQRCRDGTLAVHHDRVVPGLGELGSLTTAELPDWIPTLAEALRACAGLVVNVELKNRPADAGCAGLGAEVADVLADAHDAASGTRVLVSSFWPDTLEALASDVAAAAPAGLPRLPLALLVHPAVDAGSEHGLGLVAARGWAAVNPHRRAVTPELVRRAHAAGVAVWTWTVESAAEAAALAASGVDGVIADHVAAARQGLAPSS